LKFDKKNSNKKRKENVYIKEKRIRENNLLYMAVASYISSAKYKNGFYIEGFQRKYLALIQI
jgi:hypothetical protein